MSGLDDVLGAARHPANAQAAAAQREPGETGAGPVLTLCRLTVRQ
ncbi:hypothetical protein ACFZBU_45325 [Embleya sp. NPDC008237]